jgi:hypothetical protein
MKTDYKCKQSAALISVLHQNGRIEEMHFSKRGAKTSLVIAFDDLKRAIAISRTKDDVSETFIKPKTEDKIPISFADLCLLFETHLKNNSYDEFFIKLIDFYYDILTPNERAQILSYAIENETFLDRLKTNDKFCELFLYRYKKGNSYIITVLSDGKKYAHNAFFYKDNYYISSQHFIESDSVLQAEQV